MLEEYIRNLGELLLIIVEIAALLLGVMADFILAAVLIIAFKSLVMTAIQAAKERRAARRGTR